MTATMRRDLPWAIYIRVSTKDQGEKFSPLKQLLACASWAKANGVHAPGVETAAAGNTVRPSEYILFDKQTGKNDERPDFQRAWELARTGKIGGLIPYCVDRVARNVVDAINLRKTFKKMGVQLEFATQRFDDSPAGEMMYAQFAAFSEYEGRIILERTADGRLGRVKDGKLHSGGSVRYGYKYENGLPVIEESEAQIARIILEMGEKTTAYKIFQYLNAQGYRTRKGKLWRRETVSHILAKAPQYAGWYVYHHGIAAAKREHQERVAIMGDDALPLDTSNVIVVQKNIYPDPLITGEAAKRIMARLARNKEASGRPSRKYLLVSLLWCSICGKRWYSSPNRNSHKAAYYCGNLDEHHTFRKRCSARQIYCEVLENAVIEAMRKYLRAPETVYSLAMQEYEATHGTAAKQRRGEAEKRLAAIHREQQHLDQQVLKFDLPKRTRALAEKRLHELEIEETELKIGLRQAAIQVLPSRDGIVQAFDELLEELEHLQTFEDKREFLEATVSRIETDGRTGTILLQNGSLGPIESTGYNARNCNRRLNRVCSFVQSIPFKIKERVA